jgi:hypothetical protein
MEVNNAKREKRTHAVREVGNGRKRHLLLLLRLRQRSGGVARLEPRDEAHELLEVAEAEERPLALLAGARRREYRRRRDARGRESVERRAHAVARGESDELKRGDKESERGNGQDGK